MKCKSLFLLLLLFVLSCADENRLLFEPIVINNEKCNNCPSVEIAIPKALKKTKISEAINRSIKEEVISLLNFNENIIISDIEKAILSFKTDYNNLKDKFPEETTPWEAKIKAEITFENDVLITIKLDSYIFTGGAHGYNPTRFLNFDKEKGEELETERLFTNTEDFLAFAEKKFKQQEKIKPEATINSTGFMFQENRFHLPQNIGYTIDGVQLLYEPYEISSYSDGTIILTIPYEDINPFLNRPVIP